MNSAQVKEAFAAAGIKVRVKDLGGKFRICRIGDVAHVLADSNAVVSSLGLVDVFGKACGMLNQAHELVAYRPEAIRRA